MTANTSDLKITVEEPRSWARRLKITVPEARVRRERDEVTRSLAKRVKLPGFRHGKVPPHVMERKFGPAIEQEALERVVGEAYREALSQESLQPITQGAVENIDYHPGSDLTFDVEFEIQPVIELERLGGFHIEAERAEVTDEDVEKVLTRVREQQAVWHPVEAESPADGDMAVVEITPAGEDAEGAKPRRYDIVIGQDQAVPAVEAAIRTLTPGEENEFDLELPDFDSEQEGATRHDHVRIGLIEVKRPELPELDDEFAKSVGDFESVEALRARIREDLEREAESEAEREVRGKLVDAIVDANPFEVPDSLVNQYLHRIIGPHEDADSERLAEARQMARPIAENALRRMLVMERIADLEGLRATSAEVDARVEDLAQRQGRPVGEVWAQLQKSGQLSRLEEEITEDKVFEYLKAQSTIEVATKS